MILNRSSPWARRAPSGALLQNFSKSQTFCKCFTDFFFFLPFHYQFPSKCSLWAAVFLTFLCVQSNWSHRIMNILSLFLLSVKVFGKLFSPEDSYNWMFFTHDFMRLLIMTGFVLLLSHQLNLLSLQSQGKTICFQEKRGDSGHSAAKTKERELISKTHRFSETHSSVVWIFPLFAI